MINFAESFKFVTAGEAGAELNTMWLFGIKVLEPVATATDLLVAVACLIFFLRIQRSEKTEKTFRYFKFYFLLMSIATTLGGLLGHAFLYALTFAWKLPGWITSMFSIMFVERAAIEHTKIEMSPRYIKFLRVANIVELVIFMGLTLFTLNFSFVEFHSGYGLMFVVLSLEGYLFLKTRNPASRTILAGIAFAAVAALFFMFEIVIHPWFNHLAMSHTLMTVAAYFFYRGVTKIDYKELQKAQV